MSDRLRSNVPIPPHCKRARVLKVIEVETTAGAGSTEDPVRPVFQYWSLRGKLLAERDEYRDGTEFVLSDCSGRLARSGGGL